MKNLSQPGNSFEEAVSQYLGQEEQGFEQAAQEYLEQVNSFEEGAKEYLKPKLIGKPKDPLAPAEGEEQATTDSYLDNLFSTDESLEGQIASAYLYGSINLKSIPDELALKASDWAAKKAEEIDKIQTEREKKPINEVAPFDSIYKEGGKKPPMSSETKLQLKTAFEELSKYLKLDPDYASSYDDWHETHAKITEEAWQQHDRWQEDDENNEFPEIFRKGVGEAQLVPQDMLRTFSDGIPLSLVQLGAELSENADPVIRGSDEAKDLSLEQKKFRGRYGSYTEMWQFMGGFKRPFPKEDKRFYETLSEVGGTLMQFTKFAPGNVAWQTGQKGMGKIISSIRSKAPSTTRLPKPKVSSPWKEAQQRIGERATMTAGGAAGYELAYQETGNAGVSRLDEDYIFDKIEKEVTAAAINIPAMVVLGEAIHHAAKIPGLTRPAFYKKSESFKKQFGTPEAFAKEFNRVNDLVAQGKGSQGDMLFLQYVTAVANRMGIKTEQIAMGERGFKVNLLSPRQWTEKLPALRKVLNNQMLVPQAARKPKNFKQETKVKEAEAEVRDVPKANKGEPSEMERLAIETGEATKKMTSPEPLPTKPIDKVDPGLNFVSGLERSPTDAANAISGGGQIGVRINQALSKGMVQKIVDLTQLDQNIFIEHGLYRQGDMEKAYGDSFTDIIDRLKELVQAGAKPEKLYVMLPDALDNALLTTEMADIAHGAMMRSDELKDINFIYVMQRDKPGGKFTMSSVPVNPAYFGDITIGIPGNLSRVNDAELRSLFTTGVLTEYNKFHLLGVDPASERGKSLISVIREQNPEAIVSADTALGRTSVNAVKKENMKAAAENLGLVEDIPEHENWTDWLDEIYNTVPNQAGWTPEEISEVARVIAYDDKEFIEIFKMLNEGDKTLYEIEDIFGYELGGMGGIDRDKFARLLEVVHPKTNRGEWIKKKAEAAATPEEPKVPIDTTPEPEEPEVATEPEEPEVATEPEEPEVDTEPVEGIEFSQPVKQVQGLNKVYDVNRNDVILNEDVEVLLDADGFYFAVEYALFDDGILFQVNFQTPVWGQSGPISIDRDRYKGKGLSFARQEGARIGLSVSERILREHEESLKVGKKSQYSKKTVKAAQDFIKEFSPVVDATDPNIGLRGMIPKTTIGIKQFRKDFEDWFNEEELILFTKIRNHILDTTGRDLSFLRDMGTATDLKGKYVNSVSDLKQILKDLTSNKSDNDDFKSFVLDTFGKPERKADLFRTQFDTYFGFFKRVEDYLINTQGVDSRAEYLAKQIIEENEHPLKAQEIQEHLDTKATWEEGGKLFEWEVELMQMVHLYRAEPSEPPKDTNEPVSVKPPEDDVVPQPDEIFKKIKKEADEKVAAIRSEGQKSVKADDLIIKKQRQYITEKLAEIKNPPANPYDSLASEDMKTLKELEDAYQEAKKDKETNPRRNVSSPKIRLENYRTKLLNENKLPYIELRVPYDGIIRLINGKTEIEAFKKKIGKNAVNFRKAVSPTAAKKISVPKPTSYPTGKGDIAKAAAPFKSQNLERYMLQNVVQLPNKAKKPYETIVATDGRRIIYIKNPKQGKLPKGVVALDENFVIQDGKGGKFPNVHHVIPKGVIANNDDLFSFTDKYFKPDLNYQVDIETLTTWATSLNLLHTNKTAVGANIGMQKGTDGKISMYTSRAEQIEYASVNAPTKRKPEVVINSKFLVDIAKAAKELQLPFIEFRPKGRESPVVVLMRKATHGDPGAFVVQMPIRQEEGEVDYGVRDYIKPFTWKRLLRNAIRQHRNTYLLQQTGKFAEEATHVRHAFNHNVQRMVESVSLDTPLNTGQIRWIAHAFTTLWVNEFNNNAEDLVYNFKYHFPSLSQAFNDLVQTDYNAELASVLEIKKAKEEAIKSPYFITGGLLGSLDPVNGNKLVGKKMPDPANIEEFVKYAQILRSPNIEYSHIVGVRRGRIAEVVTTTINSPNKTQFSPEIGRMGMEYDEVYVVHNHPSGDPFASKQDDIAHAWLAATVQNYKGSIVLDHGEYTFRKTDDKRHEYGVVRDIAIQPDLSLFPSGENPIHGVKITPENAVYYINEFMQISNGDVRGKGAGYLIFYLDRDNTIRGVSREVIDENTRLNNSEFIGNVRIKARGLGASAIIVYQPKARSVEEQAEFNINKAVLWANSGNILDIVYAPSEYDDKDAVTRITPREDIKFDEPDNLIHLASDGPGKYYQGLGEIAGKRTEPVKSLFDYIDRNGNVIKQEFNLEAIPPIRFPELIKLYKELKAEYPKLKKMGSRTRGYVQSGVGDDWHMAINPDIFKLPNDAAAMTFAHEMGHVFDLLDTDLHTKRGNILGRLATKVKFRGKQIPAFMGAPITDFTMTSQERNKLRRNAEKQIEYEIQQEWFAIAEAQKIDPYNNMARKTGWKGAYGRYLASQSNGSIEEETKNIDIRIKKESKPRYQKLLAEAMGSGGMLDEKLIRAELIDLMEWWKPIPDGPPSFRAYRMSSVELYADTLSVLFCAPNELKDRAPMFWQAFFSYLPTKPDLERKIKKVWAFIRDNQATGVLRKRLEDQRKRWKLQEQILYEDMQQRKHIKSATSWWDAIKTNHYDYAWGAVKRAREAKKQGAEFDWSNDPESLWGMHPFSNNKPYIFTTRVFDKIVRGLDEYALTPEDFGQYLFNTRIINETNIYGTGRSQIANEQGVTPTEAKRNLISMMDSLGSDKIQILDYYAKIFRQMFFEIYEDLWKAGMFTPKTWYEQVLPNKDNYATFAVAEYFLERPFVPAGIKKQSGSFKEGMNPFSVMVLKAISALRLLEKHNAQKATVEMMIRYFPNEIRELDHKYVFDRNILARKKVYNEAKRREIKSKYQNEDIILLVKNGEPVEYVVPWDVAQAHKGADPAMDGELSRLGNLTFRKFFYPLFITYNPGFQWILSPMRDFDRTWTNLPNKVSRWKLLKAYKKLWRTSWGRMKGELSPIVQEMMEVGAIGTPFDNFNQNFYEDEGSIFQMLAERYKLTPKSNKGLYGKLEKALAPLEWMGGKILQIGQTFETLAKTAPYYILTRELGVKPEEAGEFVRNYTGVPPYWRRGKVAYQSGALMPFINVALKGYMMDFRLMSGQVGGMGTNDRKRFLGLGPLSGGSGGGGKLPPRFPSINDPMPDKGGRPGGSRPDRQSNKGVTFSWWMKYMRSSGMWTMLKVAGLVGLFGTAVKKALEMIPSYDSDNYHCIPLAYTYVDSSGIDRFASIFTEDIPTGAKVVYFRLPMDESQKIISKLHSSFLFEVAQQIHGEEVYANRGMEGLQSFVASQIPGVHPLLTIGDSWYEYIQGENPIDGYTNRGILNYDENLVRGKYGLKRMFLWTYDKTGLGNFVGIDPDADTALEFGLKTGLKQTIGRLIKISDGGKFEGGYEADTIDDRRYAALKLSYDDATHKMLREWRKVQGIRAENRKFVMSEKEYETLLDWYTEYQSIHDDAKECLDFIDDPAIKDKKQYEKLLDRHRSAMEAWSTTFINERMN